MNEPLPATIEALVLAELAKRVKSRIDQVKAIVGTEFEDGDKHAYRSPLDGSKLGLIWRTDPDPQWRITDREALRAHLMAFPGNVETVVEIVPEDMPEALAVLAEHAPGLLTDRVQLNPDAEQAALDQSKVTGQAAAPGIELVKPSGSLTVKPDTAAGAAVERLVEAGVITWDGRPVLEQAS